MQDREVTDSLRSLFDYLFPGNEPEKTPFDLVDLDFVAAMADSYSKGIKNGRVKNDWQTMKWGDDLFDVYCSKVLRHLHALRQARVFDDTEEMSKHAAAIACNADILHFHEVRDKK